MELERQLKQELQSLPIPFNHSNKQRIMEATLDYRTRRRVFDGRKNMAYAIGAALMLVVTGLSTIHYFPFSSRTPVTGADRSSLKSVQSSDLGKVKEVLHSMPFVVKTPTYLPFSVIHEEANPDPSLPNTVVINYVGDQKQYLTLQVEKGNVSFVDRTSQDVKLADGTTAKYSTNSAISMLQWSEGGISYSIQAGPSVTSNGTTLPNQNELLKVANSIQ